MDGVNPGGGLGTSGNLFTSVGATSRTRSVTPWSSTGGRPCRSPSTERPRSTPRTWPGDVATPVDYEAEHVLFFLAEVLYGILPLFHAYGLLSVLLLGVSAAIFFPTE